MKSKELKELALQRLPELVPALCLEEGGHSGSLQLIWHSPLHWADCSEPAVRNKCQSFVSEKVPNMLLDCNQNSINIFDYIAQENNQQLNRADAESWAQFAQWLADKLGTTYERGGRAEDMEELANWALLEESQQKLQSICQRMHSRLVDTTDQQGERARCYLARRGPLWAADKLEQHPNYGACTIEDCKEISALKGFASYLTFDYYKTCISWTTGQGGIVNSFKLIDTRTAEEREVAEAETHSKISVKKYATNKTVQDSEGNTQQHPLADIYSRSANLGGFSGQIKAKAVYLIEGQEDCDSMELLGLQHVYSIGTRKLAEGHAKALQEAGVTTVTFIRDTEPTAEKRQQNAADTRRNIEMLAQCGISSCCFEFGAPIGQKNDADSWANNRVEAAGLEAASKELQDILAEETESAGAFLFPIVQEELDRELAKENTSRQSMPVEMYQLRLAHAVAAQGAKLTKFNAAQLAQAYTDSCGVEIPASAVVAAAASQKAAEDTRLLNYEMQQKTGKALAALQHDNNERAGEIIKELARMGDASKEQQLLNENVRDWSSASVEELARFMRIPAADTLQTNFFMLPVKGYSEGGQQIVKGLPDQWTAEELMKYRLTFAAGAVHLVCARSGHGKSTMLRTMAVDAALQIKDTSSTVIYCSWEETAQAILQQMYVYYCFTRRHETNRRETNNMLNDAELYADLHKTGIGSRNIDIELLQDFKANVLAHMQIIYCGGWSVERWRQQVQAVTSRGWHISAIFGDYLQRIDCEAAAASAAVTYKIKAVINQIADEAKQRLVPIVMGAQLMEKGDGKAGVSGPHELGNSKIADSSDIVRTADTILMLFNSNETDAEMPAQTITKKGGAAAGEDNPLYLALTSCGYQQGVQGSIFARITKDREGGRKGHAAVFPHIGAACCFATNFYMMQQPHKPLDTLLEACADVSGGVITHKVTNRQTGATSTTTEAAPKGGKLGDLFNKK